MAGGLSDDSDLEQEGIAQQDKARAERDAARKEAEAEAARSKTTVHESEQRRHQR